MERRRQNGDAALRVCDKTMLLLLDASGNCLVECGAMTLSLHLRQLLSAPAALAEHHRASAARRLLPQPQPQACVIKANISPVREKRGAHPPRRVASAGMKVPGSNINTVFIPSRKGPRAAQELQGAHTRLHLVDFILQQGHRFRDRQLGVPIRSPSITLLTLSL